jgi:hypothetical protein
MGRERAYADYMKMVGMEPFEKKISPNLWCHKGEWPEIAKKYYYEGPKD